MAQSALPLNCEVPTIAALADEEMMMPDREKSANRSDFNSKAASDSTPAVLNVKRLTDNDSPASQYCRIFTDNTVDAMFLHDGQGRIVDVNHRACEHLGYSRSELIGMIPTDFDTMHDIAALEKLVVRLRLSGSERIESIHRRKDGREIPVEVRLRSFVSDDQNFCIASVHDISDRKQAEEARRHLQSLLEESQSMAHLGSYEWNVQTNSLMWSTELYHIYGLMPGEPLTLDSFIRRVHPDDVPMVMNTIQSTMASGDTFAMNERIIRPSGEIRHLESKGRVIRQSDGQPVAVIGACLDVTDRVLAARALRDSEENFRTLFESSNCAIFELDAAGQVLRINRAGCYLVGYSEQEVVGRRVEEVLHPDDREEAREKFEQLICGYATQIRHSCRYLRKDASIAYVDVHLAVARRENGRVTSLSVVAIDISAQKQLDEQIRETQKLEAVGRLAGGIAHDLNNLLMVVSGYPELLLAKMAHDDVNVKSLQAIQTAGERAARLSQQLLAFSRRAIVEPQLLRINEVVLKSEKLLRQLAGEHVRVELQLSPNADFIKADSAQIEQILSNLVVNARDAMPSGGILRISSQLSQLPAEKRSTGKSPGDWVQLIVSDSGHGIPSEIRSRIFDPFFTTKPVGKGTGLGLAVVHGIVMQSDGRIEVNSGVDQGTTMTLSFPRSASPESAGTQPLIARPISDVTIMLVEDDDPVRQITRISLERAGFRVLECSGGSAAKQMADRSLDTVHLVVTDIVMPDVSGSQLCRVLRGMRPDLPVIFISGFTADSDVESLVDDHTTAFLQKPFLPAVLVQKIQTMLSVKPVVTTAS